jgi:hypothetical protein
MSFEMLFDNPTCALTGPPELLDHDLNRYFPGLLKIESSDELEASSVYGEIRSDAERILNAVVVENLSEPPVVTGGSDRTQRDTLGGSDIAAPCMEHRTRDSI